MDQVAFTRAYFQKWLQDTLLIDQAVYGYLAYANPLKRTMWHDMMLEHAGNWPLAPIRAGNRHNHVATVIRIYFDSHVHGDAETHEIEYMLDEMAVKKKARQWKC